MNLEGTCESWKSFDEDWDGIEEILQDKITLKVGLLWRLREIPRGWKGVSSRDGFNRTQYIISDVPLATSK